MQAALLLRKKRQNRRRPDFNERRLDLLLSPHLATRLIPALPRYSPFPAWTEERANNPVLAAPKSTVPALARWEAESGTGAGSRSALAAGAEVTDYQTKALAAHRRWVRRNQIEDGGGSGLHKDQEQPCASSSVVNLMLYVGLGMSSIGLIVTFVGIGERGFQTTGLRLIGPCLLFTGLFLVVVRVCICTVGAYCANRCRRRKDSRQLISTEELRAAQGGRPVTHKSHKSRKSGSTLHNSPPPSPHEPSSVPILPPININNLSGAGPGPSAAEVLLDPKDLERPLSAGSVMSPLTPVRRPSVHLEHLNSDIDEMLRQQ